MIIEALKKRRSVRIFQKKEAEMEKIEHLIEAAQWAPSACNKQLWEYIIVRDDRLKQRIVKEAKSQKFLGNAPVVIFVIYPKEVNKKHYANIQSAAASIQNILLATQDAGLSGVWMAACGDREILHRILNIPREFIIVSAVLIGYPQKIPPAPARRNIESIIHLEKYSPKAKKGGTLPKDWTLSSLADYRVRGIRATSPTLDLFETSLTEGEFYEEVEFFLNGMEPTDKILDILSFSGNHILAIMCELNLPQVYIHDVSDDIFYFISERKEQMGIKGKLSFTKGDLTSIPSESGCFDVVTCFNKLNVIVKPLDLLAEIHRVLKDDGILMLCFKNTSRLKSLVKLDFTNVFITPQRRSNEGPVSPISLRTIRRMLKKVGFKITEEYGVGLLRKGKKYIKIKNSGSSKIYRFSREICLICVKI